MICNDPQTAAKTAQANADRFQVPYVVFFDTMGNLRVERDSATRQVDGMVYRPK